MMAIHTDLHMKNQTREKYTLKTIDVALIAILVAILEVAKMVLNSIANVELITLLFIIFTLQFGIKKTLITSMLFSILECAVWGFATCSIVYFYIWPLLILFTHVLRKADNKMIFTFLSGFFGLSFGMFCSIITFANGGINAAVSWWIAGIPYDVVHGVSNFIIALLLFAPINNAFIQIKKRYPEIAN